MEWATPLLSHHCVNTSMSVLDLYDSRFGDKHLMAIGDNLGEVDIVDLENRSIYQYFTQLHNNNVLGVSFHDKAHVVSFDKDNFIYLDFETSNRQEIFGHPKPIIAYSFYDYETPIIALGIDEIYICDLRANPSVLMQQNNITEVCVLPDNYTIMGLQFNQLCAADIRMPNQIVNLQIPESFVKLSCNEKYLAAITEKPKLYSFCLPFCEETMTELPEYDNPILQRPVFIEDYIVVGDTTGTILIVDPSNPAECDIIPVPNGEHVCNIAASSGKIAICEEDEIYVFSSFPFEDNLIVTVDEEDEFPEEEDQENWLKQTHEITLQPGECSYENYGYCEQQIYVCLTCQKKGNEFGICSECAKICHAEHDVKPIGNRRRFRCDCGNNRSGRPCKCMGTPKTIENPHNHYSHNFWERWCVCDGRDTKDRLIPMIQCVCCSDWYHHTCIGLYSENRCILINEIPELDNYSFICNDCLESRVKFLNEFPDGPVPEVISDFVDELRRDSFLKPEGDPSKPGYGFRILGGRFICNNDFSHFVGISEYDNEFGPVNKEEDEDLPPASGQAEYTRHIQQLYEGLRRRVEAEGRSTVQASDVHEAFKEAFSRDLMERRRRHDEDE